MAYRTTFLLFLLLTSCFSMAQDNARKTIHMDPAAFNAAMKQSPGTILDVRTPEEVANGKINGAVVMDFYEDDFKKQLKKLDKTKPVYVYCASGGRSSDAADIMIEMGFTRVINLEGGIKAWKAAGLPVVKPATPAQKQ